MAKKAAKQTEEKPQIEIIEPSKGISFEIQGLTPIQEVNTQRQQMPGYLTLDDVKALGGGELQVAHILHPAAFEDFILDVQAALQWLVGVGQNPNLTGFEDLNIAFITGTVDLSNKDYVDIGPYMVVQSKTKRDGWASLLVYPTPGVVTGKRYAQNVARDIVNYCPVIR